MASHFKKRGHMLRSFVVTLLLAGAALAQNVERKEIMVDPKVLARYVGVYQMGPGVNMVIAIEGNQLSSRMTNQGPVPVFAQTETLFFAKVVDAQLEFSGSDAQ